MGARVVVWAFVEITNRVVQSAISFHVTTLTRKS